MSKHSSNEKYLKLTLPSIKAYAVLGILVSTTVYKHSHTFCVTKTGGIIQSRASELYSPPDIHAAIQEIEMQIKTCTAHCDSNNELNNQSNLKHTDASEEHKSITERNMICNFVAIGRCNFNAKR